MRARISLKSFAGLYFWLGLGALVIWWVAFTGATPVAGPVIVGAGLALLGVGIAYTWLVRLSTEYRVFEDSLEIQSGIVGRRIENVQLFRVRDLGLSQSVLGRILRVGNVTLSSTDHSAPQLLLRGIDDPRRLYDTVRGLVAKSQATRRTMIVEEDSAPGAES